MDDICKSNSSYFDILNPWIAQHIIEQYVNVQTTASSLRSLRDITRLYQYHPVFVDAAEKFIQSNIYHLVDKKSHIHTYKHTHIPTSSDYRLNVSKWHQLLLGMAFELYHPDLFQTVLEYSNHRIKFNHIITSVNRISQRLSECQCHCGSQQQLVPQMGEQYKSSTPSTSSTPFTSSSSCTCLPVAQIIKCMNLFMHSVHLIPDIKDSHPSLIKLLFQLNNLGLWQDFASLYKSHIHHLFEPGLIIQLIQNYGFQACDFVNKISPFAYTGVAELTLVPVFTHITNQNIANYYTRFKPDNKPWIKIGQLIDELTSIVTLDLSVDHADLETIQPQLVKGLNDPQARLTPLYQNFQCQMKQALDRTVQQVLDLLNQVIFRFRYNSILEALIIQQLLIDDAKRRLARHTYRLIGMKVMELPPDMDSDGCHVVVKLTLCACKSDTDISTSQPIIYQADQPYEIVSRWLAIDSPSIVYIGLIVLLLLGYSYPPYWEQDQITPLRTQAVSMVWNALLGHELTEEQLKCVDLDPIIMSIIVESSETNKPVNLGSRLFNYIMRNAATINRDALIDPMTIIRDRYNQPFHRAIDIVVSYNLDQVYNNGAAYYSTIGLTELIRQKFMAGKYSDVKFMLSQQILDMLSQQSTNILSDIMIWTRKQLLDQQPITDDMHGDLIIYIINTYIKNRALLINVERLRQLRHYWRTAMKILAIELINKHYDRLLDRLIGPFEQLYQVYKQPCPITASI